MLNPDVTYQPDLPASNVMGQYRTAQKRCRQSPDLTGSPLRSLSSRCLILTIYIYLQLQWLEQAPLVCWGKVWEGQREYCPFTGVKPSVRCAGTQTHCRGGSHMTTQCHLLFAGHDLIQRSWVSGKSDLQCQVTEIFCNKYVTGNPLSALQPFHVDL